MNPVLPNLDPLLHQPARTQLVAYLNARGESSFSELKRVLAATDGNLGAHLSKLQDAGYISQSDLHSHQTRTGRSQTLYRLTPQGQEALMNYIAQLHRLLSLEQTSTESAISFVAPWHTAQF